MVVIFFFFFFRRDEKCFYPRCLQRLELFHSTNTNCLCTRKRVKKKKLYSTIRKKTEYNRKGNFRSKDELVQKTTALCQIFGGYIQNKLECSSCKKFENKYGFFTDLSLDLSQCSSLDRCLSKKFKEEAKMKTECSR